MTDLYGALVRWDPNTHANVPATKPGCKVIDVTLKDIVVRGWTSDFKELAPVDLPIVANTRVFLPALAEKSKSRKNFPRAWSKTGARHWRRSTKKFMRAGKPISKSVGTRAHRASATRLRNLGGAQKGRLAASRRRLSRLAEPSLDLGQAGAVFRRLRRWRIRLWSGRVCWRVATLSRHRQDLRRC